MSKRYGRKQKAKHRAERDALAQDNRALREMINSSCFFNVRYEPDWQGHIVRLQSPRHGLRYFLRDEELEMSKDLPSQIFQIMALGWTKYYEERHKDDAALPEQTESRRSCD